MADALTIFFVVQFLVFIGCFFFKIYAVLSLDEALPIKVSVMSLIIGLFSYGVGLFTILSDYSSLTYNVLFRFESMFVLFFLILFFIEIFIFYKSLATTRGGYRSNQS